MITHQDLIDAGYKFAKSGKIYIWEKELGEDESAKIHMNGPTKQGPNYFQAWSAVYTKDNIYRCFKFDLSLLNLPNSFTLENLEQEVHQFFSVIQPLVENIKK